MVERAAEDRRKIKSGGNPLPLLTPQPTPEFRRAFWEREEKEAKDKRAKEKKKKLEIEKSTR